MIRDLFVEGFFRVPQAFEGVLCCLDVMRLIMLSQPDQRDPALSQAKLAKAGTRFFTGLMYKLKS